MRRACYAPAGRIRGRHAAVARDGIAADVSADTFRERRRPHLEQWRRCAGRSPRRPVRALARCGTLAVVGLFVIPYKRKQAKDRFSEKMEALRVRLQSALTTQFGNEAENAVYRSEKMLKENADKISSDDKSKIERAVGEVKEAVKGSDVSAIRSASEKLNEAWQAVSAQLYKTASEKARASKTQSGGKSQGDGEPKSARTDEGPVIDAEVVEEKNVAEAMANATLDVFRKYL